MQIQRYGLRIVGLHDQVDWQPRLLELAGAERVLCHIQAVSSEAIELEVEATCAGLETIGYEILYGALGYAPRFVIVQNPDRHTYHLRQAAG
ncbi:hypothetical protein [Chitinolyticbacter meiyuanensis]|uniref:hypothetical protein n=1 Tax=Chitinolyticbacter meiyuanensis TaxID=682798 RepID=UPI0011E59574|nr:hypothetical protein [Chitinolyticbacter meiyuanensis]